MVIFYKKWKKYYEIQLTKKNGLKYSKIDKLSTLPEQQQIHFSSTQSVYSKFCWFSNIFKVDDRKLLIKFGRLV